LELPILLLALLFSVIVHECAHGIVADRFGDPTARHSGRLTLNPLPHIDPVGSIVVPAVLSLTGGPVLGWAKPVPVNVLNLRDPERQYPYIAAAGPASNLLLAFACAIALGLVAGIASAAGASRGATSPVVEFLILLMSAGIRINVILALFNLIPVPPLDGSWIVMRFLPPAGRELFDRIRPFGIFVVLMLLMAGLWRVLGPLAYAVMRMYIGLAEGIEGLFV
jgi:Zn-dependent protease